MNFFRSLRFFPGILLVLALLAAAFAQGRKPSTPKPAQPAKPSPVARASHPTFTNSIGMEFVQIPAGSFWMGSENSSPNCPSDDPFTEKNEYKECMDRHRSNEFPDGEMPRHRVTIGYSFGMGKYEVTQEQWYKVMGYNPASFKSEKVGGDSRKHPVDTVSWNDVQEFIRRLNEMEQTDIYRLPSEAEWEYACRGGTTTNFAFGSSLSSSQASFGGHYPDGDSAKDFYREKTTPVGSFAPNAFGLFDMHGNVCEWCQDVWHDNYNGAPSDGSAWLSGGDSHFRVLRGGSRFFDGNNVRSASRSRHMPEAIDLNIGFRLVCART